MISMSVKINYIAGLKISQTAPENKMDVTGVLIEEIYFDAARFCVLGLYRMYTHNYASITSHTVDVLNGITNKYYKVMLSYKLKIVLSIVNVCCCYCDCISLQF